MRTTDTPGDIIAVTITAMAITMATTGPTTATATDGPMVMVMGVAGATKTGHSQEHSIPIAG